MLQKRLGIDLGTVNVLVHVAGRGIVLQEPSIVAISPDEYKIMAVGAEASSMMGRAPESIEVLRPMRDGVIADYRVTHRMLQYFIHKASGRVSLFKPKVMVSVPYGVTSVERRAVREAALDAGAGDAYLIPEPLAGALGAGLPVDTPAGSMVVNMGGGTSQAAVISLNGIVRANSVRIGGVRMNEAIMAYIRRKYNLLIGEMTAEKVKIQIGAALPLEDEKTIDVQGRDQVAGLPHRITITSEEVAEALSEPLSAVITMVKAMLEQTPPELSSDIIDRGMVLIGGGALLRGIDDLISRETGVPSYVADAPMACVALGAGMGLAQYEILRRTVPDM